jgi:hypothetical protein
MVLACMGVDDVPEASRLKVHLHNEGPLSVVGSHERPEDNVP